ncbi:uncharacterized protein LOC112012650 [Quercus suber]|uniref:uncharacterized protein LOC112012650 n=1 Tax=Quercus suber TaxID=58331 RepID=UPI000CE2579A|nr:uncharacterized protein LOC112012650 [Quercus suber]
MAIRPSSALVDLERQVQREYSEVLNQEQELWAVKSRLNWMMFDDRNMYFFHVSTIVRRRRNWISYMKNNVGEWIQGEPQIMEFTRKGFGDLYTTNHTSTNLKPSPSLQSQAGLTDKEKDSLMGTVTSKEIKSALWTIKAFKALGPDDIHAEFFQRFWLITGESVINEVKKIFE